MTTSLRHRTPLRSRGEDGHSRRGAAASHPARALTKSDGLAFAYGYMQHRVRKTGRLFRSEWALHCEVRDGRISTLKMFEDTAALTAAYG
jgi:ketosteroid isomerase-like protein